MKKIKLDGIINLFLKKWEEKAIEYYAKKEQHEMCYIKELVTKESERKKKSLLTRLANKIDIHNVIFADLKFGIDGDLNGYIHTKDKALELTTILAYGDIQKPHYRVLIKEKPTTRICFSCHDTFERIEMYGLDGKIYCENCYEEERS